MFFIPTSVFAQDTLLIRDVFDFNVGDEFHYLEDGSNYYGAPFTRKVDRIRILAKEYSINKDTINYKRSIEGYSYNRVSLTQYEYHPHAYENVQSITDLDSNIFYYMLLNYFDYAKFPVDWEVYYPYIDISDSSASISYCNTIVNSYEFSDFSVSELAEYGNGLGLTRYFQSDESCTCTVKDYSMIYYKKGVDSCGTPDYRTNTGLSTKFKDIHISLYPNPFNVVLNMEVPRSLIGSHCEIFDITGNKLLLTILQDCKSVIDLQFLDSGTYYLKIRSIKSDYVFSIIKL
jgi:hypothetical protein